MTEQRGESGGAELVTASTNHSVLLDNPLRPCLNTEASSWNGATVSPDGQSRCARLAPRVLYPPAAT